MIKSNQQIWRNNRFIGWRPNFWDFIALLLLALVLTLLAWGASQMEAPYLLGQPLPISLSVSHLPMYALRSVMRLLIAMLLSLIVTFVFGALAAKNKHAERILIPMVDVLQSVPVLGFLSITVAGFIALFPGSLLGPECAAIFAIFSAQVWNMILGFYQSLKTLPKDISEAANMLQLSSWQRFWRVEVPFAMPSLTWNMMLSMSASWFFVVACEAISVNNQTILLPGIGSYIAVAILHADKVAIVYSIITMLIVILLYDQLCFRPIVYWAEKFKYDLTLDEKTNRSWLVDLLSRTRSFTLAINYINSFFHVLLTLRFGNPYKAEKHVSRPVNKHIQVVATGAWYSILFVICTAAIILLFRFIFQQVPFNEVGGVLLLGVYTSLRVLCLIVIASLVWVPIGVWIGMNSKVLGYAQPVIQILAAFPANLIFPVVVFFIITFRLNIEIWVTPLMLLGAQWYILFNVIAGTSSIPKELHYVTQNFGISKWLWWRRFVLPAIFPFYITGAITAAGGAWNASIVAEVVGWGDTILVSHGLGAYIAECTTRGDFPRIALGIVVMCLYVLVFNRLLWQPLYNMAQKRYSIN
ncbi:MAG: ABC transporter permease subunit [Desulfobacteraceae bacterium]|nr:ABC transporter permease subunit [Desulfobacteraceae bacterium]